ncbi:MAG: phosphoribosylglycinamide synthetase C domain-containing protein, partial [Acutalibacteraceae bacterium]
CVIMASGGYPGKYEKGIVIKGLNEDGQVDGATVFHAGSAFKDGQFVTNGGRVLGVTAKGKDLDEALDRAYEAVEKIDFSGAHYRTDIGRAYKQQ